MQTHYDRKQICAQTCKALKKQGLVTYRGIANATGIDYQSLRSFIYSGNLGPEDTSILYEWLLVHGHIKASTEQGSTATTDVYGDVLEHAQIALDFALSESKKSSLSRKQRARILFKQIKVFWEEWATDLARFGGGG